MPASEQLLALARRRYVSLTTYRRTGAAVSTPVWVGRDGDALIVLTAAKTGKAKRLRNNPRVTLRPSNPLGRVRADAPTIEGTATILTEPADVQRGYGVLRRKYGLEYLLFRFAERFSRADHGPDVILRIT